jgi:type IV pilus assembly protein PilN
MIKINLLPIRADKKKESVRNQLILLAASITVVVLLFLLVTFFLSFKINSTKAEITVQEGKLAQLKVKIGKINNLEKLKADVQNKLNILNRLRKEKNGPVQRLLILSQTIPDKLWITKYSESGATATLNGIATDEELIANYMRSLDTSSEYSNVELIVSEQIELGGQKAKKFELKMSLKNAIALEGVAPAQSKPGAPSGTPVPQPLPAKPITPVK